MHDEPTLLLDDNNQPMPSVGEATTTTQQKTAGKGVGAGTIAAVAGASSLAGAAVGTVTPYVVATALMDDETTDQTADTTAETTDATGESAAATAAETTTSSAETTANGTASTTAEATTVEGMHVAHVDASSFSEAFAEARAQVGPGGVFEYEGRVYGTYYANEWNALTPAEQADFTRNAMAANSADHAALTKTDYTPTETDNQIMAETDTQASPETDGNIPGGIDTSDASVEILATTHVSLTDGADSTAIIGIIDDNPVIMVDIDNDNEIDAVIVHTPDIPDVIASHAVDPGLIVPSDQSLTELFMDPDTTGDVDASLTI